MTTLNPTRVVLPIEPRDQDGYHLSQDVIKVRVEGPKEVEAKIEKKSGGELVAVFTATQSGDYHVHLTHNGKHIKFSPMVVKVEAKKDSHSSPPPVNLPGILFNNKTIKRRKTIKLNSYLVLYKVDI